MFSEEILRKLYCSLSHNETDKHIASEPYKLSCGHLACKKCIRYAIQPLECSECDSKCFIDINVDKPSSEFKEKFELYSHDLFTMLCKEFENFVNTLDYEHQNLHQIIDRHIESLKEQISVRVELLKATLNTLRDDLIYELHEKKYEMKNRLSKINMDEYRRDLDVLKMNIELNQELTERLFIEYQEQNDYIKKTIKDMKDFDPSKLTFTKSNDFFEKSIIGSIELSSFGKVINRVRRIPIRIFDFDFNPCSLCSLPNGYILGCDNSNKRLVIFDMNFNLYKSIDRIKDLTFTSLGISTDCKRSIYISDYHNHRIIQTDFEFKLLSSFGSTPGNGPLQLLHPYDVFYYDNYVYVCDCRNQRIQKLTAQLEYEASYSLTYQPWQIKITGKTACVRANNSTIYFYSLNNFSLNFKYENHDGPISEYNSYFYEFSDRHKKLFCYDSSGKLDDEATIDVGKNVLHTSYRLTIIDEKLIISAQKRLIVI